MNKLFSALIAAAVFATPVFAADAPKANEASAQLVTPASDAAAMKEFIAQRKTEAAKAKAAKKPAEEAKPAAEAKPAEPKKAEEKK